MGQETTPNNNTPYPQILYMALELGQKEWKLGFTVGPGQPPRLRNVMARDLKGVMREIRRAKERFGLVQEVLVRSCYEAGRDGFWVHRYLRAQGIDNLVVDSASIEVNRRWRRAKTDRMDTNKLLSMLVRYHWGEKKVWSVIHVPTPEEEDRRHLHRNLMSLKRERTRQINRIKGLLASQGVVLKVSSDFLEQLAEIRLWDGSGLRKGLFERLEREYQRMQQIQEQVRQLEQECAEVIRTSRDPAVEQVRQLMRLRGIGENSAWLYVMELFSWRGIHNRSELGALCGLTPTPYQSGESNRERGISKAGNRPVRAMAVEIAWSWLRYQPDSGLSCWYRERFADGGSRIRRIGIVALARRLLVELWKYLESGIPPAGAYLSETTA